MSISLFHVRNPNLTPPPSLDPAGGGDEAIHLRPLLPLQISLYHLPQLPVAPLNFHVTLCFSSPPLPSGSVLDFLRWSLASLVGGGVDGTSSSWVIEEFCVSGSTSCAACGKCGFTLLHCQAPILQPRADKKNDFPDSGSYSTMNVSVGFAERLLLSWSSPSLSVYSSPGGAKWGGLFCLLRSKGYRGGFRLGMMASSLEGCGVDSDVKMAGVVRPAIEDQVEEAIVAIKAQKVIAVPTDTLYGFACDACSTEAVCRIYEIKGRQHTSPLAICVADVVDIPQFAETSHLPHGLLGNLLPGPVTVVLKRGHSSILEKSLNPGLDSIGVRVPDCSFIRLLARGSRSALALTSANLSGHPSSVSIRDFESLWPHCEFVYDGGLLPVGRTGSTVVDLTELGAYTILRPGSGMEGTIEILERHGLQMSS